MRPVSKLDRTLLITHAGGFLAAQADRNQYLYYMRTTEERVARSCVGEMEREVHEILSAAGVDKVRLQTNLLVESPLTFVAESVRARSGQSLPCRDGAGAAR